MGSTCKETKGGTGKEKLTLTRAEAVKRLQGLADQIKLGTIMLENKKVDVPEKVRLEIKADRDELEVELKWKELAAKEGKRPEGHVTH